jgi:hypothetical protein
MGNGYHLVRLEQIEGHWTMWVNRKCHWCCTLKAEPNQNVFYVFLLINVNCLGQFISCDMQTNIYLRVPLSDAKHSFHFIKNVNNFIYLNVACTFVIDKYVKNKKEVNATHIHTRIACWWNEMVNGEKTLELMVPNPQRLFKSIKCFHQLIDFGRMFIVNKTEQLPHKDLLVNFTI